MNAPAAGLRLPMDSHTGDPIQPEEPGLRPPDIAPPLEPPAIDEPPSVPNLPIRDPIPTRGARHGGAIALVVAALASPAFVPFAFAQGPLAAPSPDASVDDARIAQAVRTAIGKDSTLAGQAIKVASLHGAVVLSGRVRDGTHIKRAAFVASRVPGVRKVTTSLAFTAPDTTLTSLPPGRIA